MNAARRWWSYAWLLIVPLLLWGVVIFSLWEPVQEWLSSGEAQDHTILHEWLDESRGNLPGMVEEYLDRLDAALARLTPEQRRSPAEVKKLVRSDEELVHAGDKIREYLDSTLGTPPTKIYSGTQPLFATFYRIAVVFHDPEPDDIVWDSLLPSEAGDYEELTHSLGSRAEVRVRYQLHAYDKRQSKEELRSSRIRQLALLAIIATALAVGWMVYVQGRQREQERRQALAQHQIDQAERLLLQEELRRQEAERRQQETEHALLQERLAAQEYEQKMLEMKSQLYASIGIMAGSYAHNIKNLLVRPADLLRRCLEADGVSPEQARMLAEVKQTLGMVTERLQQILQTVRRDPTRSQMGRVDLGTLVKGLEQTWREMAWDRWKLQLVVEAPPEPLWIEGDLSHLQQTVENLLFNARDATFEMRLHLRDEARKGGRDESSRRQALIAAAAWKGQVTIRIWRRDDRVILEVRDNGIGMSEEVKRRCTETHFSTKRDNAGYEGHTTGMGLGLSFVQMVLDNHGAQLEITTAPLEGATFRATFKTTEENKE